MPPGWDWWNGLVGNSRYYNYTLSVNGSKEKHLDDPTNDYLTSVIWRKSREFLSTVNDGPVTRSRFSNIEYPDLAEADKPFFMMLSTPAPHQPFTPEPKYNSAFANLTAPRTSNFNIKNNATKHWLLRLGNQPLSAETIAKVDENYRDRLRTLLTVDDMVGNIMKSLQKKQLLDNTYIIFTSDNGYHLGQFSLPLDKREPYEFDIRVPFSIRGPSIPEGIVIPDVTVNIDLAPTILDLAGITPPSIMDGRSLKPLFYAHKYASELRRSTVQSSNDIGSQYINIDIDAGKQNLDSIHQYFLKRNILVEHTGEGYPEQTGACSGLGEGLYGCNSDYECKCSDSWNNTYSCVRQLHMSDVFSYTVSKNVIYCKWRDKDDFIEYYDIGTDGDQLYNSVSSLSDTKVKEFEELLSRLTKCTGSSCL